MRERHTDLAGPLLVLDLDPSRLEGWLSEPTRRRVRLLAPGPPPPRPGDDPDGPAYGATADETDGWVYLPADGPTAIVPLALQGLAAHLGPAGRRWPIAVYDPQGAPPPLPFVREVAASGARVAVDLTRCRWWTDAGAWVTGRAGASFVGTHGRGSGRALAQLLETMLPASAEEPAQRWLSSVSRSGAVDDDGPTWDLVLRSLYLDVAVTVAAATPT